jgi:hypothetical protein
VDRRWLQYLSIMAKYTALMWAIRGLCYIIASKLSGKRSLYQTTRSHLEKTRNNVFLKQEVRHSLSIGRVEAQKD